ncbi:MAG: hypothetical protein ABIY35_07380 [Chitinophagaceae bacterium]
MMLRNLILLLFFNTALAAQTPTITEVRTMYHNSSEDGTSCRKLVDMLSAYTPATNPLLAGYEGGALMMLAKHAFNPFTKLSYFKKGRKILEAAIVADAQNTELRFIRFATQCDAPGFLGYDDNLNEDKSFLLKALENMKDKELKNWIVGFMKNSKYLSETEKRKLNAEGNAFIGR